MASGGTKDGAPIRRIARLWLLPSFAEALDARAHEGPLLSALFNCVQSLMRNPATPGLNFEFLRWSGDRRVFSARINLQYRLILVEVAPSEVALAHVDNHDEAYSWVDAHGPRLHRALDRASEMPRSWRPGQPLPFPRSSEERPIAVPDVATIRRMLEQGMWRYLAHLDEHQAYLSEVEAQDRKGPTVVKGGAGTGKTALAIARVRYLAQRPEMGYGPALYLCFNRVLANTVTQLLDAEFGGRAPAEHVRVSTFHHWCAEYLKRRGIDPKVRDAEWHAALVRRVLNESPGLRERLAGLTPGDVAAEIRLVLLPNDFDDEADYLQLERRGMKLALRQPQRSAIWEVYRRLDTERDEVLFEEMPRMALRLLQHDGSLVPYRGVVIDEAQDCSAVMIRIARALTGGDARRLFALVDSAQSIFENGFYWAQRELGARGGQVNVLKKTYRTTRQVHALATSLYARDEDMRAEVQLSWPPARDGPMPVLHACRTGAEEAEAIAERVSSLLEGAEGWLPEQVAVLAPSWAALQGTHAALARAGVAARLMPRETKKLDLAERTVKLLTIHSAKGLDFPIVYLAGLTIAGLHGPETTAERAALLYVGMTRSSFALTMSAIASEAHDLLFRLDTKLYELTGAAAAALQADPRWDG